MGTKSILVKRKKKKKMALNYFSYHSVLSDSGKVTVNTHITGPKFMWEIIVSFDSLLLCLLVKVVCILP